MLQGAGPILRSIVAGLRSGDWVTRERIRFYAKAALFVALTLGAVSWLSLPGRSAAARDHLMYGDFIAFWTAGSLALQGQAAAAYDFDVLAVEQARLLETKPGWPWFYPPTFLLPMAVLAALPYAWALVAWLGATALAYLVAMHRFVPDRLTLLVALAFPAFALNATFQQNGFLWAALLGIGILALEAHAVAAGIAFGLLCFKPQLAVLVPFALLAGRHWRALLAMTATVVLLVGATVVAFGTEAWWAMESSAPLTTRTLEQGRDSPWMMVTPFAAVRHLGGAGALAWWIQVPLSLAALLVLIAMWRRPGSTGAKGALLAALVLLATPYAFFYDLVVLAVAIVCLAREGIRYGFMPWEKTLLTVAWLIPAAWLAPALMRATIYTPAMPLVPWVALGLAACAVRRQLQAPVGRMPPSSATDFAA